MLVLPSILFGAIFTLALAWMLGHLCLARLPAPPVIVLAVGAAVESTLVFLLLLPGIAHIISFAILAAVCAALLLRMRHLAPALADPVKTRADRTTQFLCGAALLAYAALYVINAMAPELEPDAIGYHLGLTAEYVRLRGFPDRVGFYEMLPQGLEMLFVPAFAFGRHSAARLVHCGFLLATAPLIIGIARRLALSDSVALTAAVLYFCAPMTGITGTSAYTDAGAVFFLLATFYLLLVWRQTRDLRYLLPAGITAGFCYAIKMPGGLVLLLALIFIVAAERAFHPKPLAVITLAALVMMAPWVLRAYLMTGNPAAPLFNRLFPNEFFHPTMEIALARTLSSWRGVPAWRVPYELVTGGAFQGMMGLAFFALPAGLPALRRPAGRLCWAAAVLLALPWLSNTGARFLMPALPFFALALAMSLPRRAQWALVIVQALACWPQIFALYHPAYTWRLERIPWRAALRIQPEHEYLWSMQGDYRVACMLQNHTRPGDRIFALSSIARAYTDREILEFWHSAQADNLSDALRVALLPTSIVYDVKAEWPRRVLEGVRIREPRASPAEWLIHEIAFFSGSQAVAGGAWQLRAQQNVWDLPLAFDDNQATRWRTWAPIRAGSFVEIDFAAPAELTSALMTTPDGLLGLPFEFYGRQRGDWVPLNSRTVSVPHPIGDVRLGATRALRRAGFRYLLAARGTEGNSDLANAMYGQEAQWNLERVAELGPVVLFHVK